MTALVFIGCDNGTTSNARNTDALDAAITTATALNAATSVGTEVGDVPLAAKTAYTAAIAAAQAVSEDLNMTQADIDAAVETLAAATVAFNAAIIQPDPQGDLADYIAVIQAEHDAASEGTANGEAAAGSKATLATAIAAAQTVHDDAASVAADYETAADTLGAAFMAFDLGIVSYGIHSEAAATSIDVDANANAGSAAYGHWSDDGSWTGVMPVVFDAAATDNVAEGAESWTITYDGTAIGGGSFIYYSDTLAEDDKTVTDLSAYNELVFYVQADTYFGIQIESGWDPTANDGAGATLASYQRSSADYTPVSIGDWDIYTIPLADFNYVDFTEVTIPVGFWNADGWESWYTGVLTFDNVVYR